MTPEEVALLLGEPLHGSYQTIDGRWGSTVRDQREQQRRSQVVFGIQDAIAALTSSGAVDYLAGRKSSRTLDTWIWLPPPRPRACPDQDETVRRSATSTPAAVAYRADGLNPDEWADLDESYAPIKITPEVCRDDNKHTVSVWRGDVAAQARQFLLKQAENARLGGGEWLRRNHSGRVPLPPIRDRNGHTRSRYLSADPRDDQEADAIFKEWGRAVLARQHAPAGAPPRSIPSALDTLFAAISGSR